MKFKKHIFICTNQRTEGQRKSCGEACGMELVHEFKRILKEKGMNKQFRAQRTGCLDACETGPSLVVYPDGTYYGGVTKADVAEIIDEHILNNRPVARLVVPESST